MVASYLKKVHKYIVNFTERKIENFSEMIFVLIFIIKNN